MKKLFTFNVGENAQVGLLKDLLETSFVRCVTRNEHLSVASGEIPFTECYPELWILNDEDYPGAKEVLDGWLTPQLKRLAPGSVAAARKRLRTICVLLEMWNSKRGLGSHVVDGCHEDGCQG